MSDLKKVLVDIADAIRYKMSSDAEYAPVDFADQILEIPTSGGGYSDPTPIINGTVKTVSNSASFTRAGCLAYCSKLTTANLSNCENVGSSTFYDCNKLRAVHLENCKVINEYAFYSCSALSKIDIPLCERIDQEAFHWAGLQSISLPNCSYVGNSAFQACNNLSGDPHLDVCKEIGSSAFNGAKITTLNLPECVSISDYAFGFNSISEWSFPNVEYIGASAFTGAIVRPNYSASISSTLFLPKCSYIGSWAFSSCGFVSVSLPECSYIGAYAFAEYNTCYITELILPKAKTLGYGICNMNTYESSVRNRFLTKVYIPECTFLDYGRYYNWHGCFNSHTALSEVFAPKLTYITNGAFYGCSNLTSLTLNWSRLTAANRGAFNRVPLKELRTPYLGNFSSSAFEGCNQLSIIETPKVLYVEENAIRGTKASCLELPEAAYVQAYGVGYCNQLETIETYQLSNIYSSAFTGCTKLENFIMFSSSCNLMNTNAFANTPLSDETLLGHFGSIYVPSEYVASYKTASNWSKYADRITELPSEIINKYIRTSEFINSTISSIPLERRNAKYVFNRAFSNCINLTDASLPNCIYLSSSAFYGDTNLTNVYLPKCIILGGSVFANCYNLTNAYLPAFYSGIPEGLFCNCSNLSGLVISSDVTGLYTSCFESCAISSICLVNCSYIGYQAFRYCKNLSAVYLLSTQRITISSPYSASFTAFHYTPMYNSTYLGSFGSIFVRASLLSDYVNYCASDSRNYYLSSRFAGLTDEQVEEILNIFYPNPEQ